MLRHNCERGKSCVQSNEFCYWKKSKQTRQTISAQTVCWTFKIRLANKKGHLAALEVHFFLYQSILFIACKIVNTFSSVIAANKQPTEDDCKMHLVFGSTSFGDVKVMEKAYTT